MTTHLPAWLWVVLSIGATPLGMSLLALIEWLLGDLPHWLFPTVLLQCLVIQIISSKVTFGYNNTVTGVLSSIIAGTGLAVIGFFLTAFSMTFLDLFARMPSR